MIFLESNWKTNNSILLTLKVLKSCNSLYTKMKMLTTMSTIWFCFYIKHYSVAQWYTAWYEIIWPWQIKSLKIWELVSHSILYQISIYYNKFSRSDLYWGLLVGLPTWGDFGYITEVSGLLFHHCHMETGPQILPISQDVQKAAIVC